MFCPKCGGDNDTGRSYCRHCGQSLKTVELAVDGRAEESIAVFRKASESLTSGLLTFAIFFVLAIIAYIAFGIWPAAIDLLLGLVFSVPQFVNGLRRQRQAERILTGNSRLLAESASPHLPGRTTESMEPPSSNAASVTEHTTFRLEPPDSSK